MATTTRILDANVNGTVYTANANSALEALDTCHSGATAPTDEVANGKLWLDTSTTPAVLKVYDNAGWNIVYSGRGDLTVDGYLDIASTGAAKLPVGTGAQRPTPATGQMRFNTDDTSFEGYDGSAWGVIGGGGRFKGESGTIGSAVGAGDIFRVNEQELNTNVTIDAAENASATGPLAVASGVTLAVTTGGNLSIV